MAEDVDALILRVRKVEKRNRVSVLVLAGISALLVLGQASLDRDIPESIDSRQFVLVDGDGKPHAIMRLNERGSITAEVRSETSGGFRTLFTYIPQFNRLEVEGEQGITRQIVNRSSRMFDRLGNARLNIGIDGDDGSPYVVLSDERGTRGFLRVFADDGSAKLELWDKNEPGRRRLRLTVPREGPLALALVDGKNRVRAELGLSEEGTPSLKFRSEDGKVVWKAP